MTKRQSRRWVGTDDTSITQVTIDSIKARPDGVELCIEDSGRVVRIRWSESVWTTYTLSEE